MKSKLTLFILLTTITTLFMACGQSKNTGEQADMHTSEIALDWQGVYYGVLPCADCEGIEVELRITEDGTYTMKSQYLGKENGLFITEGTFVWENGNKIKLEDAQDNSTKLYQVEENQLRMLDNTGNKIAGELEAFYVLTKGGNSLVENKKWQLVEVFGQPVDGSADTHYLIFHAENNTLEAIAGCNVMLREYVIKNELVLQVKSGITTLMACPDDTEDQLIKVLNTVDNISVGKGTLTLNKARMAPMAVLKEVKE